MKTVSMQGLLVEVARKFTASPGDLLVIVNGVCLGVQDRTPVVTSGPPTLVEEDILSVLPVGAAKNAKMIGDDLRIDRKDVAARNILSRLLASMLTDRKIEKVDASVRYADYRRGATS